MIHVYRSSNNQALSILQVHEENFLTNKIHDVHNIFEKNEKNTGAVSSPVSFLAKHFLFKNEISVLQFLSTFLWYRCNISSSDYTGGATGGI